jgi:hypothetical protein
VAKLIHVLLSGVCIHADNQSTLSYYGLDGSSLQSFLGFLALFFLFWFTCAWLALSFKKYSSR